LLEILWNRFQISLDTAESHLQQFRNMTLYFPFVIIPSSVSADGLAQNNPLLLLAILAASSWEKPQLQAQLEALLRKSLTEKILLGGEKSLELLSALMTYLGWYHFYQTPKIDMAAQFLSLAMTVCEDLGLGLTPSEAALRPSNLQLDHYRKEIVPGEQHDPFFSREARRLYLGTYYLCTRSVDPL
jgi:hypothetical protein